MKRTVLTFGLIAGGILSLMLLVTLPFHEQIGDKAELIGYTSMVAAFLLIFFGVRAYRDNVAGGRIGFGRAFAVGALIAAVSSVCYVATWQVVYHRLVPDFGEKYVAHVLDQARASGESAAARAAGRSSPPRSCAGRSPRQRPRGRRSRKSRAARWGFCVPDR